MTASISGVTTGVDKNDQATSVALLREMLRIRELEQRSLDLSTTTPPEVIGSAHFCAGQEAVPVGAIAGLAKDDQIVATYRGHGWALASGLSLTRGLRRNLPTQHRGQWGPRRLSIHDGARTSASSARIPS